MERRALMKEHQLHQLRKPHQHHQRHQRHGTHRVHALVAMTISAPLASAWKITSDFYGLQKWVPTIRKCFEISPGVRYAESYPQNGKTSWVKEQLTCLTPSKHTLSYKVVGGNFGLDDYAATMRLASAGADKTTVHWSFGMSSSSRRTKEQQEEYLRQGILSLERAAKRTSY